MNGENAQGDRRGPLGGRDEIEDGGIDRTGRQEETQLRPHHAHQVHRVRVRGQRHPHEGRCNQGRDRGQPQIGPSRILGAVVAQPAADESADKAGNHHDGAEAHGGLAARNAARAFEKRRHPHGETAHGKGVGGVSQNRQHIRLVAHEPPIGRPRIFAQVCGRGRRGRFDGRRRVRLRGARVLQPARRIPQQQAQHRQQQAGNSRDEECHAPAIVLVDQSADHVAQRRTHRYGAEENGHHAPALTHGKIIRQ